MLHRISVSSTGNGSKSNKLGLFDLAATSPDVPEGVIGISGAEAVTPKGAKLALRSSYVLQTCNLCVAVLADGVQVFMGAAHWDKVTPYFGFRISSGEFIHLHFQKAENSDGHAA